jgi:hypothetical protein
VAVSGAPPVDLAVSGEVLRELRRTRRHNRLADVHWIDALYRVYIAALGAGLFVLFASSRLPDDRLTFEQALTFADDRAAWLGLGFALALAIGFRSGGRGGPLVLEAPVVFHELQAPIDREDALRSPAVKQFRFLAFAGALTGGIAGEVAARRLPVSIAAAVACGAAAFALAAVAASGAAMILSGRRVRWWAANALALAVVAWSAIDMVAGIRTSPMTFLAELAFWPIEVRWTALVGVATVGVLCVVGLLQVGGISTEAAMRRAGLVSQLRFAVTLQDVRTVVLLRRQLSQERPRAKPWVRTRRAGRLPEVWRRDWQSYFRFPLMRVLRMVVLGAVAGLALGAVWRGVTPMVVPAGLALYLAAFDAAEPVAQEVDHPSRWESFPTEPGKLLLLHLPATFVVMALVSLVGAAAALVLVPAEVVLKLTPVLLLPVAAGAAIAGAVGTAQGAPDVATMSGLGPDMMGFVLLGRLVLPPAIVVACLLPVLAAGTDVDALRVDEVSNAVTWPLIAVVVAFLYLRTRKPKHL